MTTMACVSVIYTPRFGPLFSEGALLVSRRLQKGGLTQEWLRARLDVGKGVVSHWIHGRRRPRMPMRLEIRALLRVPVSAWDRPASPSELGSG